MLALLDTRFVGILRLQSCLCRTVPLRILGLSGVMSISISEVSDKH
jgi:hypothetical protein